MYRVKAKYIIYKINYFSCRYNNNTYTVTTVYFIKLYILILFFDIQCINLTEI